MWVEDEDLEVFCDILSDVFVDHYISPSTEWASCLLSKDLQLEYNRFFKKKQQAEKFRELRQVGLDKEPFHFGVNNFGRRPTEEDFQLMAEFLLPKGSILNVADCKKAFTGLTLLLEGGGYIPIHIQNKFAKLGILIESDPISKARDRRERRKLVVQTIAQAIAYEKGRFNEREIKNYIFNLDTKMKYLTFLNQWNCINNHEDEIDPDIEPDKDQGRSIEKLISKVNPLSKEKRKGRGSQGSRDTKDIKFIPGIFQVESSLTRINYHKLRIFSHFFAITLRNEEKSLNQIIEHPVFIKYQNQLPVLPLLYDLMPHWAACAIKYVDSKLSSS
jgi:hypothetical protein